MQLIFKITKWLHKYIGLILILFMIWMAISGILMNHPDLISSISVPGWLVPEQYHIKNWNRSSLINLVFLPKSPDVAYLAGKQGIWKSEDGGYSFSPMTVGLPNSDYYRKTKHLLLLEDSNILLAATQNGLFYCDLKSETWQQIKLDGKNEPVNKIIEINDKVVAFTGSNAYEFSKPSAELGVNKIKLNRNEPENRIALVKLFFDLHGGKAWGLPGKLLFDMTGLIIIFLSLSAFYAWYFPWQRKRNKSSRLLENAKSRRLFKFLFKYHLKIGIWICIILLVIGGTGLFMRPPLLAAIANGSIPASVYPAFREDNPWEQKIQNALYDSIADKVIIQCTDGFWAGKPDFKEPFNKINFPAPVFVMGTTVFETYGTGGYLVGSFNGIFHQERKSLTVIDLVTNKAANGISSVRPGEFMVTGYFKTPDAEEFITTHEQGLIPLSSGKSSRAFNMPESIQSGFKMPLWNYLFEIHNGRFFQGTVGSFYILIVPLGSLLFLLITITGIYDWLHLNVVKRFAVSHQPSAIGNKSLPAEKLSSDNGKLITDN